MHASQIRYFQWFIILFWLTDFWNVKWARGIYEENNEIKYSDSTATWNVETNFHLEFKILYVT